MQFLGKTRKISIFCELEDGFDPGPEWTLEFYFTHASRAGIPY